MPFDLALAESQASTSAWERPGKLKTGRGMLSSPVSFELVGSEGSGLGKLGLLAPEQAPTPARLARPLENGDDAKDRRAQRFDLDGAAHRPAEQLHQQRQQQSQDGACRRPGA